MRVASILDPFFEANLSGEFCLQRVMPGAFPADVSALLVNSCWGAHERTWMALKTDQIAEVANHYKNLGVPTIFMNTEDPAHFGRMVKTALQFDAILTSDANAVDRYKAHPMYNGQNIVPFSFGGSQKLYYPIEGVYRNRRALFAGSWYNRYVRRCGFLKIAFENSDPYGVDIYVRNPGSFPKNWGHLIKGGGVPYEQMNGLYAQYRVAINPSSVTTSPTMCANRTFDMMLAGIPFISNKTPALARLGCAYAETPAEYRELLSALMDDDKYWQSQSTLFREFALSKHTWSHRAKMIEEIIKLHSTQKYCKIDQTTKD